jgi:hypothetical protein
MRLEFVTGRPYRRECDHDTDGNYDWSDCDDQFCPIYLNIGGARYFFVADARCTHPGGAAFPYAILTAAQTIADAFDRSIADREWCLKYLPRLLMDDCHCWLRR